MNELKALEALLYTTPYYIFGMGYIAQKLTDILEKKMLLKKCCGYIVSEKKESIYNNKPVVSIDDMNTRLLVVIAVHEALRFEVESALRVRGVTNILFITDYLYHLQYSEKISKSCLVNTIDIIRLNEKNNYYLETRSLVFDQFNGKSKYGYGIYLKMMELVSGKKTAQKRLAYFINMIESCEKNGFDRKKAILIDKDFTIVDGMHRLTMAYCYSIKAIQCDVLDEKYLFGCEQYEKEFLTEAYLSELFDKKEIIVLQEKKQQITEMIKRKV